ncbi:hypothetical protein Tco_1028950 [Tanacetum coccineum]|uniref:Uncharacterized protein n=1 Tax=Tanacetum coccineum TaxID=301880 RepID=A0ABQ5G3M2_9ASTR
MLLASCLHRVVVVKTLDYIWASTKCILNFVQGGSRRQCNATFEETTPDAQTSRENSGKWKVKTEDVVDQGSRLKVLCIKTWGNSKAGIPASVATNFLRTGIVTSGGNPQPVYWMLKLKRLRKFFIENDDLCIDKEFEARPDGTLGIEKNEVGYHILEN